MADKATCVLMEALRREVRRLQTRRRCRLRAKVFREAAAYAERMRLIAPSPIGPLHGGGWNDCAQATAHGLFALARKELPEDGHD